MTALIFPHTIFKTIKRMDDYTADDMRFRDLTELQLKQKYNLVDVSTLVEPYTLRMLTSFNRPQSMFFGSQGVGQKITRQQCADILFDEFRQLSKTFSFYGPYKHLIQLMITHMQRKNGAPFSHNLLNIALKEQILRDFSEENSTRLLISNAVAKNIDWKNKNYPENKQKSLSTAVMRGILPKFNRLHDNFNGMGITVHDIWSARITIKKLNINERYFNGLLHYKIQDHFGLDDEDILKLKFKNFRFFRIWFLLQHYDQLGFKPFMTNIEASIEITGERNEN